MWTTIGFGAVAALFLLMTISALRNQRWVHRLPALSSLPLSAAEAAAVASSRVSVVIPARDEEARLEAAVRRLWAQRGVTLEIVVVDDRSADRTPEILRRLSQEDARLRPLRVESLPDGWLGKCHACHAGASAATGEWLLFTDADCWLKPDVIARALRVAAREHADHVTMTPGTVPETLGAAAWHLAFLTRLTGWIAGVNRDRPDAHFGIGAFNLVRASAYRDCGGYPALRLSVVDDVKLGLLLRRAGKRSRAFIGGDDAECHWGTTVSGIVEIMEKNYFAAADYRVAPVTIAAIVGTLTYGSAVYGPFSGHLAGWAAALALASLAAPAAVLARRVGWPLRAAALSPLLYPVLIYALVNSTVVTLRHGGISWRGTFYPLALLRRGGES